MWIISRPHPGEGGGVKWGFMVAGREGGMKRGQGGLWIIARQHPGEGGGEGGGGEENAGRGGG